MSLGKRKPESTDNLAAKQSRQSVSSFFAGLKVHLYPAALGPVRKKIFEKQIQSHGGELVADLTHCTSTRLIIVIDNSSIEPSKLKSFVEKCESVKPDGEKIFVGTSWLSECLEKEQLMPYETHLIKKAPKQTKLETATKVCTSEDQPFTNDNLGSVALKYDASKRGVSTSKFVCAQSSNNPTSTNLNEAITKELEKLAQTYKSKNDRFV